MQSQAVRLDDLLLDPNNYRIQEQEGFITYPEERFHLELVQSATRRRLREENLDPLRNSIIANGFLEIERIVVMPSSHVPGKFLVIEGNRRVAALQLIREQHEAGIELPENVIDVFESVPCLVVEDTGQEPFFREAIMGIRHVGGIREWGGFQRAKLIADLRDNHALDPTAISDRIGLSVIEVNRRYRAFKVLQQMQEDEDYAANATPKLYPLFHEAVSLPAVRDWLGWNSEENRFDDDQREVFYQLISPRGQEEGEAQPAKIKSYSEVRALREILPNADAKADLMQMDREFVDALTIATRDRMSHQWKSQVNGAKTALLNVPALEVEQFETQDVDLITGLIGVAERIVAAYVRSQDA